MSTKSAKKAVKAAAPAAPTAEILSPVLVVTAAQAAEPAPKAAKVVLIKVRVLRSHPALGYGGGEEADVPVELYEQYKGDASNGPFLEKI